MEKEKYSIEILRYFIDRCRDKIDYHDTIDHIKLDSINEKKAIIGYRKGHPIGTRYVVARDCCDRELPDMPLDTETVYDYKNEQITVYTSILNKAQYYENVYIKAYKLKVQYIKKYYDCIVYKNPDDSLIDAEFYEKPMDMTIEFKSEEHKRMADEISKNFLSEIEKIEKKYNIEDIGNSLYPSLDRYLIKLMQH